MVVSQRTVGRAIVDARWQMHDLTDDRTGEKTERRENSRPVRRRLGRTTGRATKTNEWRTGWGYERADKRQFDKLLTRMRDRIYGRTGEQGAQAEKGRMPGRPAGRIAGEAGTGPGRAAATDAAGLSIKLLHPSFAQSPYRPFPPPPSPIYQDTRTSIWLLFMGD